MHRALLAAGLLAASAVPLETAVRDERVACAEPGIDLDQDGAPDLACITRRGESEPQRLAVVLSSAPGRLALDAPVLHCPTCGGALGLATTIAAVGATIEIEERGGSREEWRRGLRIGYAGSAFQLVGESYAVRDRISGSEIQSGTSYEQGVAESQRMLVPGGGGETVNAAWLDIYAIAAETTSLRPRIRETVVDSADYLIGGAGSWSGPDDLSFAVRAQSSGAEIRIAIDVKDDDVRIGKRGDRVELWWDRGGDPWTGNFEAKLEAAAATTTGVSLHLLPAGKVGLARLFPANGTQSEMRGSWKRTPSGYALEIRAGRRLFTGPSERRDPDDRETLVNATIVVRDVDAGAEEETALATSKLEHRGAPFEMGCLHLPRLPPVAERRHPPR